MTRRTRVCECEQNTKHCASCICRSQLRPKAMCCPPSQKRQLCGLIGSRGQHTHSMGMHASRSFSEASAPRSSWPFASKPLQTATTTARKWLFASTNAPKWHWLVPMICFKNSDIFSTAGLTPPCVGVASSCGVPHMCACRALCAWAAGLKLLTLTACCSHPALHRSPRTQALLASFYGRS